MFVNIILLHAHDAGRFVQPYGHAVETPHLMKFAKEGVLFRKAFCAAPTCGPSRSALFTGTHPHQHGMFGLPGRQGWLIDDYRKHLVQFLSLQGYETVLAGVQHEADHADFSCIGYQRVLGAEEPRQPKLGEFYPDTIERVEEYLATAKTKQTPFFLSVGIDEPHRDNFARPELGLNGESDRFSKTRFYDPARLDARYTAPPPWLPDLPEIRRDTQSLHEGVRIMDEYMGRVFYAVEHHGLSENTLVIVTTDHGIEFPGGKFTLTDQGLGVLLIMRGPGGFGGGRVLEPMVSHLDIYPTLCDLLGAAPAHSLEGKSLLPLVRGESDGLHGELFSEQNYHGRLDAMRAVRTERHRYVRHLEPVARRLTHAGPSTAVVEAHGWYDRPRSREELYDLYLDPMEACNRIDDPAYAAVRDDLSRRLDSWMARTNDPFACGSVPPVPNDP